MKLSVTGLAASCGLIWGGAVLVAEVCGRLWPPYGVEFLAVTASIYPGYRPGSGLGSIVVGTLYGLTDGAVGGALLAWLYNRFAQR